MTVAKSNYLENKLIDHVLRNVAFTSPTTVYLALYTTDPTEADSGTEVAGGSYARQAITFSAPVNGATDNSAAIVFPTATGSWGTITHVVIRDALTVGNPLYYGPLTASKTVASGDRFEVDPGELDVSET
jgi:hypothetical protein